nr:MAG TPA: hypothetical protein [Bacteriophage sp.]
MDRNSIAIYKFPYRLTILPKIFLMTKNINKVIRNISAY